MFKLFKKESAVPLPSGLKVVRRKVKYARIEIKPDGEVQFIAPPSYSNERIREFYLAKRSWIEKTQAKIAARQVIHPSDRLRIFGELYEVVKDESEDSIAIDHTARIIRTKYDLTGDSALREQWLRGLAVTLLKERTYHLAARHNLKYSKVTVRSQKSKWGSCSHDNNISLNWRLIMTPPSVIEYLICHELAHTVHHNHSAEFWRLVQRICPDYMISEQWLKDHERELMAR